MEIPEPRAGQVISYAYVWRGEAIKGAKEGRKDRPCVIVLAAVTVDNATLVTVAPVTHSIPEPDSGAIEIPLATKRRLGLDNQRSWIVVSEVNRFIWPGYDLRATHRGSGKCLFGTLPRGLFNTIRDAMIASARKGKLRVTSRN